MSEQSMVNTPRSFALQLYVVAVGYVQKECGMYSRTINDALIVRGVLAIDEKTALEQVRAELDTVFRADQRWYFSTYRTDIVRPELCATLLEAHEISEARYEG